MSLWIDEHLRLAILRYMAGWYVKREDIEKARLGAIIRKHRGGLQWKIRNWRLSNQGE